MRAFIDLELLDPPLQRLARRYGGYFPAHLLDIEDFTQIGFLGMLAVSAREGETPDERCVRQLWAGECEMKDAMRALRDRRWAHSRKGLEIIVDDPSNIASRREDRYRDEQTQFRMLDLSRLLARLSFRERTILIARLQGITMLELAEQLRITEGRVSQIVKGIVAELQEVV